MKTAAEARSHSPNYGTVLEQNQETSAYAWAGEAVISARIYFDNTVSMEGFTFNEKDNGKILETWTGTLENALLFRRYSKHRRHHRYNSLYLMNRKTMTVGEDGDGKENGEIQSEEMKEYGEGQTGTIEGMD